MITSDINIKKIKKVVKTTSLLLVIFSLFSFLNYSPLANETVNIWLTNGDQSQELTQQASVNFSPDAGTNPLTITVDGNASYQTMDGFGYTFTEGSAEVISTLTPTMQDSVLNDLFNPVTGLGVSLLRVSIGACDLSSSVYSYDATSGDVNMNDFGLTGPDSVYLIPMLKRVLLINPNIKILATPWSAPTWMKSNNSSVGGNLNTGDYAAYALYFVKYIQAMEAQGINVWAITPQNEPENPNNNPSMTMNSTEETNFINNNLGPAIQSAGLTTKIICYDHNCDDTNYPIAVANNSSYVDGSAFHLYAGDISALTTVYNATNKNVYFTEQYTAIGGSFSYDLEWHLHNVVIGSVNNWAKTVIEWTLATDPNGNPHTSGGCNTCLGPVTINNSTTYTRNVGYYILGHISKFVNAGAVRISSNNTGSIENAAFRNPDGSMVMVVLNDGGSTSTFKVKWGTQSFSYTLAAGAVATFKWNPAIVLPVTFTSITAKKQGAKSIIDFITTADPNNDYFIVERSSDGVSYSSIGRLDAKENNSTGASYSYVDESPLLGNNFYRIRQVDKNGKTIFSEIRSLNFSNNTSFIISPNPVGNDRGIEILSEKNTMVKLQLFDASGKLVYKNMVNTNTNLYLPKLTGGVYIYSITADTENKIMGKLMLF